MRSGSRRPTTSPTLIGGLLLYKEDADAVRTKRQSHFWKSKDLKIVSTRLVVGTVPGRSFDCFKLAEEEEGTAIIK